MKYRALDHNGDYLFGQRGRMYKTGKAAIAQAIKTRLLLLQGEWWEDTGDGLPLFQRILRTRGSEQNLGGVDVIVQDRILTTPGVTGMKNFQRTFENRTYGFVALVETTEGEVEITNGEVSA